VLLLATEDGPNPPPELVALAERPNPPVPVGAFVAPPCEKGDDDCENGVDAGLEAPPNGLLVFGVVVDPKPPPPEPMVLLEEAKLDD